MSEHLGEAFVGAERLESTVLGETVNIASRLDQLRRETVGGLAASADLLEAACAASAPVAGDGRWSAMGEHALHDRREQVAVFP